MSMEWLSWLALILLPLAGYSAGVVLAAGQRDSPRPALRDLLMILLAWVVVLSLRMVLELNHWIVLAVGLVVGLAFGWVLNRISGHAQPVESPMLSENELPFFKRLTGRWKRFVAQVGDFQSRVVLGYFYFVVVLPFGLLVRLAIDPLQLRRPSTHSLWVERPAATSEIDDARGQF